MNILWTGDRGFIAGYAIQKLLDAGHTVIGIDNDWKYGPITKPFDNHPNYKHYKGDVKDSKLIFKLLKNHKIEKFVMGAAIIGGISLFHTQAYFLLSENEKITAASFDAAIKYYEKKNTTLKKVIVISSSMVFENATLHPTPEGHQHQCPPPTSTYGFQKLATEYFAQGAYEQHKLPYIVVRPFNCVGIGEYRAQVDHEIMSGNVKLAMSHVVPDLIQKMLKGQDPLHILGDGNQVRHYTYGGDLGEALKIAIESPITNDDFNLSVDTGHTVLELAQLIWKKINPDKEFRWVSDQPFTYDVQLRVPDTQKSKNVLGFEAKTRIEDIIDEIIEWCRDAISKNLI